MSVERGLDPRRFALVAFGGAGPLHANALAVLLGCYPVLIPPSPGVLSAYGFHTVGHRATFTRTSIRPITQRPFPSSAPPATSCATRRSPGSPPRTWPAASSPTPATCGSSARATS
ncbi:MAG: hydantoinase/oxoprolinase family protein [Thermoleophilia bacterium]